MGRFPLRLTALLLTVCLLLTGCSFSEEFTQKMAVLGHEVAYEDMPYTRPDMDALHAALDTCCDLAETESSAEKLMEAVYAFYDEYDGFYTNYVLADIHYSHDLTDPFWEREYDFCAQQAPAAEAAVEQLFYALAASPLKEELEAEEFWGDGFFDAYEGEPTMDETLLALMEQEAELESRYYELDDRYTAAGHELDDQLFEEMAQLYIQLIRVRQEMADYLGYPDYPSLAYNMYYWREYAPQEAISHMTRLGELLRQPYMELADSAIWEKSYDYCSEQETFRYLKTAANAMGGSIGEAFAYMEENGLYDIRYGKNKLNSSFETYIWNYYSPFVFMNPYLDQADKLTFAHEFGHFAADFACDGTFSGTDVAETHSQAMEYLSLCYGEDTGLLTRYKLADSLCIYVEQSAYGVFEHQVYDLRGAELTEANITALYTKVGQQFGFDAADWDPREYVTVIHFFTDPMYTVSYVLSNDLAMQFYQLELEEPGAGLALYEESLLSQESYILTFAQSYGLESPFSETRLQALQDLYQNQ